MFGSKTKSNVDTVDVKEELASKLEVVELIDEVSEFVYKVIEEVPDPQRQFFLAVQALEFTERAQQLIQKMGATR